MKLNIPKKKNFEMLREIIKNRKLKIKMFNFLNVLNKLDKI